MEVERYFTANELACKRWEKLIEKYESEGYEVEPSFELYYPDSNISTQNKKQLQDTLRLKGEPHYYRATVYIKKEFSDRESVTFYQFWFWTDNSLKISSHDLNLINSGFDYFAQVFNLNYCDKRDLPGKPKEKVVFLAHSFDETGNLYASRLSKLFDLLGFEVLSGQGFSPTSVSQKVRARLRLSNLVVVVLSEKDDFTWLVQESTVESRDKPVFVLLEEGMEWKAGIHGDIEYIEFPKGNIDFSFVGILEGLDEQGFIESYRRKARRLLKTLR